MISLVIPVYNEEVLVDSLFARVRESMLSTKENFEVILVDDGSTDSTLSRLKNCNQKDSRFKILTLSRNFGHQAAYTAGLTYAKGDYVGMMDGDLQDPPELIAEMYEKMRQSDADIFYGKRTERNEKASKKLLIRIFHFVFRKMSNLENIEEVGNFSIMSRKALNAFLSLTERNRYLPGLRAFIGFKQGYVEYSRPDRKDGEAKMTFSRLFSLAIDAVFSFSNLPVKICLYSGLVGVILIIFALIYIIIGKVTGLAPLGWSSTLLSIYFIGSVQLLSIGILGEYVFRIYKETQGRPIFIVNKFIE
ncbi:MAG TPA: glycosyltransferase family 2 protein [Chitinophagaceae bacterium]|nr:glycosyltransferase family 2 protein [Chitinophagaceae bacterium]